jgi:hypothetical protein
MIPPVKVISLTSQINHTDRPYPPFYVCLTCAGDMAMIFKKLITDENIEWCKDNLKRGDTDEQM